MGKKQHQATSFLSHPPTPQPSLTMSQTNLLELAKQGDANAIASLMNRSLQPKGITAKLSLRNNLLFIFLESPKKLDQKILVQFIHKGMLSLQPQSIEEVKIYGKNIETEAIDWIQAISLIEESKFAPSKLFEESSDIAKDRQVFNNNPATFKQRKKLIDEKLKQPIGAKEYSALGALFFLFLLLIILVGLPIAIICSAVLATTALFLVERNKRWYEKNFVIITLLISPLPPVGLYFMWKYSKWSKKAKWVVISALASMYLISILIPDNNSSIVTKSNTNPNSPNTEIPSFSTDRKNTELSSEQAIMLICTSQVNSSDPYYSDCVDRGYSPPQIALEKFCATQNPSDYYYDKCKGEGL
jgi:hypothetical protein